MLPTNESCLDFLIFLLFRFFTEYVLLPESAMGHAAYVTEPRVVDVEYYHIIMMCVFLWLPQVLASIHIWIPGKCLFLAVWRLCSFKLGFFSD